MNTGPANCASQLINTALVFLRSTERAKETVSVTKGGGHRWTFTYQRTTTITNEWTTSITMSVIDKKGLICFRLPRWGPVKAACWCYTAAGRHFWLKTNIRQSNAEHVEGFPICNRRSCSDPRIRISNTGDITHSALLPGFCILISSSSWNLTAGIQQQLLRSSFQVSARGICSQCLFYWSHAFFIVRLCPSCKNRSVVLITNEVAADVTIASLKDQISLTSKQMVPN